MGLPTGASMGSFANIEERAFNEKVHFFKKNKDKPVTFEYYNKRRTGVIGEYDSKTGKVYIKNCDEDFTDSFDIKSVKHYALVKTD